MTSHMYRILTI